MRSPCAVPGIRMRSRRGLHKLFQAKLRRQGRFGERRLFKALHLVGFTDYCQPGRILQHIGSAHLCIAGHPGRRFYMTLLRAETNLVSFSQPVAKGQQENQEEACVGCVHMKQKTLDASKITTHLF